jgi:hypothetical protein
VLQHKIGLECGVGGLDQKIGVFEIAERQHVDHDPEDQQQADAVGPAGQALRGDASSHDKIENRDGAEQRQIERIPPTVEQKGSPEQ